jgi:hypothetical protein
VGRYPSPTLWWSMLHFSQCYKPSPLQAHWGRWCHTHLLWPACLFTVPVGGCPSPTLRISGHPALFASCPFCFFQLLVYYSDFFPFFLGWGSVCPGGYADLFQGCLCKYHVLLSSPGGLLLPSRIAAGIWQRGIPLGFSI